MICKNCQQYIPLPQIYIRADEGLFPQLGSAGYDLYAAEDHVFFPGEMYRIPTSVSVQMPENFEGQIRPDTELSMKGMMSINSPSTIDHRGEIEIALMNATNQSFYIKKGETIARLTFHRLPQIEIVQTVFIDPEE